MSNKKKVEKLKKNADRFMQKGDFNKAIEEYKAIIEIDGQDPTYLNYIGDLYIKLNNKALAINYFLLAIEAYESQEFYNNAVAMCRKILRQETKPDVFKIMGRLLAKQGFNKEAVDNYRKYIQHNRDKKEEIFELYDKMLELDNQDLQSYLEYSHFLEVYKRYDEAMSIYKKGLAVFQELSMEEAAGDILEKMKELDPDSVKGIEVKKAKDESEDELMNILEGLSSASEEEEEELKRIEKESRKKAEEEATRQAEIEAKKKADEERRKREEARQKAEAEARRKAEEDAKRKAAEEARKKAAEEEAIRQAEIEAKKKADEERRKREEARQKAEADARRKAADEVKQKFEEERKKQIEISKGKLKEILDDFSPVAKDRTFNEIDSILEEQSATIQHLLELESMVEELKEGFQASETVDDADNMYDLGIMYKDMGLYEEAITQFRKIILTNRDDTKAYEMIGEIFLEKEELDKAMVTLKRGISVAKEPLQCINLRYMLAIAFEQKGYLKSAIKELKEVYATNKNFKDTEKLLKKYLVQLKKMQREKKEEDTSAEEKETPAKQPAREVVEEKPVQDLLFPERESDYIDNLDKREISEMPSLGLSRQESKRIITDLKKFVKELQSEEIKEEEETEKKETQKKRKISYL
ncbi:MAG: tetratricopeptide repeat protein [Candidatus Coatesbacteria bacterium]|nr:tetratricopeptide repeat protein [Candidatus Coatesbacteria bacterium]